MPTTSTTLANNRVDDVDVGVDIVLVGAVAHEDDDHNDGSASVAATDDVVVPGAAS